MLFFISIFLKCFLHSFSRSNHVIPFYHYFTEAHITLIFSQSCPNALFLKKKQTNPVSLISSSLMAFQPAHDVYHTLQDMILRSLSPTVSFNTLSLLHWAPAILATSLTHRQVSVWRFLVMVTPPGMPLPGLLKGLALGYHLQLRLLSPSIKRPPVISAWYYVLFYHCHYLPLGKKL